MKWKQILPIGLLVVALAMFTFPDALRAIGDDTYCDDVCLCKDSMEVSNYQNEWDLEAPEFGECGIVKVCVTSYCPSNGYDYYDCVDITDLNPGEKYFGGVYCGLAFRISRYVDPWHCTLYEQSGRQVTKIEWWYQCKCKATPEQEPEPWVRGDLQMACYNVWVNEDDNFQFIFWYPYADNNWVRIYDMEGKMVFETDMPWDNPNLIVDLPDGTYTVKTFHDQPEPLQEFVIAK